MNTTPYLTDDSLMPSWSKAHGGKKMANVPASYLMWLYENKKCGKAVKWYIERNMDAIQLELNRQENNKRSDYGYSSK
jgi:hypothetical protein